MASSLRPRCRGPGSYGSLGDGTTSAHYTPLPLAVGGRWRAVVAGSYFGCAITTLGRLYCWGYNPYGTVGDGTNTNRPVPQLLNETWATLPSRGYSSYHTCAIHTNGSLFCWGYNNRGQVGDGTQTTRTVPTAVAGGGTYAAVETGLGHTCAIRDDRRLFCFGRNDYGQVGDGSVTDRLTPTLVWYDGQWAIARTGDYHTCAIRYNGQLWCW